MTPQESHPFSVVAEYVNSLSPERSRLSMRAVVIATSDAGGISRALMRDHRVVPCRQPSRQREGLRRTDGISDRLVHVHRMHSSMKRNTRRHVPPARSRRPEEMNAQLRAPKNPSAQPLLFGIGNFGASRHPARSQGNALTIGPRAFHIAAPITFCNGESGCHRVFQGHSVLDTKKCAFACRCTGRAWRQPPVTHWTRVRTFGPIMIWSAPRVDGSDPL